MPSIVCHYLFDCYLQNYQYSLLLTVHVLIISLIYYCFRFSLLFHIVFCYCYNTSKRINMLIIVGIQQ